MAPSRDDGARRAGGRTPTARPPPHPLAVSVLPESALRPGMRVLGPADGFPTLPSCKIALIRNRADPSPLCEALAGHIVSSLDNLSTAGQRSA